MENEPAGAFDFQTVTSDALSDIAGYLPYLAGGLAILLAGWLIARIVRATARRMLGGVNRILDRTFRRGALSGARLSTTAISILSELLFWTVLLLSAAVAARLARLPAVSGWLDQIAAWMPGFLVGVVIIIVGYFISLVVGEQVATSARAAKAGQSALMGKLVQSGILIAAVIIGLDQIGVDVTFLVALFAVSVGAIFVGFSIAFGLGAREYVSNLIGARTARQYIKPGTMLRIGDVTGEVLEITATQIALDTAEGLTLVPARMTDESAIVIVSDDKSEGPHSG